MVFGCRNGCASAILPYVLSQAAGAFAASGLLRVMFGTTALLGATLPSGPWLQAFIMEFVLTWLLMFVVLCVSTGPKEMGVMAGIAVGGLIGLEAAVRWAGFGGVDESDSVTGAGSGVGTFGVGMDLCCGAADRGCTLGALLDAHAPCEK